MAEIQVLAVGIHPGLELLLFPRITRIDTNLGVSDRPYSERATVILCNRVKKLNLRKELFAFLHQRCKTESYSCQHIELAYHHSFTAIDLAIHVNKCTISLDTPANMAPENDQVF